MSRRPFGPYPDCKLCAEFTELVKDTESELLFNHSSRTYLFAAMTGERLGLRFDSELLYAAAVFQDMGLTQAHSSPDTRFEVDGANVARDRRRRMDVLGIAYELFTEPQRASHWHG
jgi:hypothetical protein